MADITGMPEGAFATFDIFDISAEPAMRMDGARGKILKGVAKGEWVVKDKSGKGDEVKIAFEAIAKSKASEKKPVDLKKTAKFTVRLHIDPTTKKAQDDRYILISDDESFQIIKTVKDDQIPGDDCLDLAFSGNEEERQYTLIVDPGKEGDPYLIFKDIKGSQLLSDDKIDHSDT